MIVTAKTKLFIPVRGPIIRPPRRAPPWPPSAAKRPADGGDAHDRVEADAEELEVSVFSERVRVLRAGVESGLASRAESGCGRSGGSFPVFRPRERGVRRGDREGSAGFVLTENARAKLTLSFPSSLLVPTPRSKFDPCAPLFGSRTSGRRYEWIVHDLSLEEVDRIEHGGGTGQDRLRLSART